MGTVVRGIDGKGCSAEFRKPFIIPQIGENLWRSADCKAIRKFCADVRS